MKKKSSDTYTLQSVRQKIFNLPKECLSERDYVSVEIYLKALKKYFIELVNKLDDEEFHNFSGYSGLTAQLRKEMLITDLNSSIEEFNITCLQALNPVSYIHGRVELNNLFFEKSGCIKDRKVFLSTIRKGRHFYRIRKTDDQSPYKIYKPNEMYLIPPDLSSHVATARYNNSGKACLYLAESLYLAWEECRRPDFHTTNFVRFYNRNNLKVFNLTIPYELNCKADFFRAYLSLVCSAKCKDADKHHWQYEIGNLFTSMISEKGKGLIDGIQYLSSRRFDMEDYRLQYSLNSTAYVFIPKDISDKPCKKLANKFEMTEPYSYFYFKMHSLSFRSSKTAITREYQDTIFAKIEQQLQNEKTIPCIDIVKKRNC